MQSSMKRETTGETVSLKKSEAKRNLILRKLIDYKYALDQSAIVAITDKKGIIQYVNNNFCEISKYTEEELIGQDHRMINSGYHSVSFIKNMWRTIARGKIWRGEFCNRAKDGSFYWVDTVVIPFLNEGKKPYQYLSIRNDITDKKELQAELLEQQKNEQLKIAAKTLEAQEKERHAIGMELHDNVNQLLASTKLVLSMVKEGNDETRELVASSMAYLQNAIDENRKISHKLVTPSFNRQSLTDQVKAITNCMFRTVGIKVHMDLSELQEELMDDQEKLAIYRIVQEQCTNISKHSLATEVNIAMKTKKSVFVMAIADNGKGMEKDKEIHGVGIENINSRLSLLNGVSYIYSQPGKGFTLQAEIPIKRKTA